MRLEKRKMEANVLITLLPNVRAGEQVLSDGRVLKWEITRVSKAKEVRTDIIDELMKNPRKVENFTALTREQANER